MSSMLRVLSQETSQLRAVFQILQVLIHVSAS